MAGDLPPRRPSTTPPPENPDAVANPGNVVGTSNVPENTTHRNGKGPEVPDQSANQGVSNRHYTEAQGRRGVGRPRKDTSRRRNETEGTRTETIHTVGQTHTGPVTRQAARTSEATQGTGAQASVIAYTASTIAYKAPRASSE